MLQTSQRGTQWWCSSSTTTALEHTCTGATRSPLIRDASARLRCLRVLHDPTHNIRQTCGVLRSLRRARGARVAPTGGALAAPQLPLSVPARGRRALPRFATPASARGVYASCTTPRTTYVRHAGYYTAYAAHEAPAWRSLAAEPACALLRPTLAAQRRVVALRVCCSYSVALTTHQVFL